MLAASQTEPVPQWNPWAGEWVTVTVPVASPPARARRTHARKPARRQGPPRDLAGLSDSSPLPAWWRDTAFAPCDGFADTRTWIKPPAMKTGRAPVVMPASDAGQITETTRRR